MTGRIGFYDTYRLGLCSALANMASLCQDAIYLGNQKGAMMDMLVDITLSLSIQAIMFSIFHDGQVIFFVAVNSLPRSRFFRGFILPKKVWPYEDDGVLFINQVLPTATCRG